MGQDGSSEGFAAIREKGRIQKTFFDYACDEIRGCDYDSVVGSVGLESDEGGETGELVGVAGNCAGCIQGCPDTGRRGRGCLGIYGGRSFGYFAIRGKGTKYGKRYSVFRYGQEKEW